MSFRLKIILGVLLIQGTLLAVLIGNGLNVLRESSEEALLNRTKTTAKLFSSTTQAAVLSSDLAALESMIKELLSNPGIVYARVTANKVVLAEGGDQIALRRPFMADTSLDTAIQDGVFDIQADILVSGEKYGFVEIGFSTTAIQTLIQDARNKTLALAFLDLGLVAVFTILLGVYLTRQLRQLQDGTNRIAAGELGHQLIISGRDELAQTASAFNLMSSRLKHLHDERAVQENEIRSLNTELEQRVVERTMQLQELNQQLEHQALHDSLTNLPNRILFHDRLNATLLAAQRSEEPFALIGVDLNLFKEINDSLGHHAGDLVLQHVAKACSKALRDSDTVARMGGDEFSILLPKVNDSESALRVAKRVLSMIEEPVNISGQLLEITASLGIAIYPDHGTELTRLINHADVAMYEAKRNRFGVTLYNPELGEGRNEAMALKAELRRAIDLHELVLHFQPKIDFASQRINGVEALVRWNHPRQGLLFPDRFIQLAENSGLIKSLTVEVMRLALTQIKQWRELGIELPISVNISALNLQDKGFPEWVAGMITEYETPPRLLELEVTETAIMTEPLRAIENIRKLSSLGVMVSIDDFGTGYSSMAYLQKLLVAKIKIDRSFVREMGKHENDEVIVRSTIDLAHNLGLKAVAEGVENQESWEKLRDLGCDSAQGYYMSKPLPATQFLEWMHNSPWGVQTPVDSMPDAAQATG